MRISDWSSDVCSSDLRGAGELDRGHVGAVDVTGQEDDVLHAILDDGVEHGAPRGGEGGPGIALRLPADLLVRLTLAPLARGDRVRREDAGGDHELRQVDWKSVVEGKRVPVRVDLGGCRHSITIKIYNSIKSY